MSIQFSVRFPVRHQSTPILEIVDEYFFGGEAANFGKRILTTTG
jgi:hypothetical protein